MSREFHYLWHPRVTRCREERYPELCNPDERIEEKHRRIIVFVLNDNRFNIFRTEEREGKCCFEYLCDSIIGLLSEILNILELRQRTESFDWTPREGFNPLCHTDCSCITGPHDYDRNLKRVLIKDLIRFWNYHIWIKTYIEVLLPNVNEEILAKRDSKAIAQVLEANAVDIGKSLERRDDTSLTTEDLMVTNEAGPETWVGLCNIMGVLREALTRFGLSDGHIDEHISSNIPHFQSEPIDRRLKDRVLKDLIKFRCDQLRMLARSDFREENHRPEADNQGTGSECVVCYEPIHQKHALIPCGHANCCQGCIERIRDGTEMESGINQCPICNEPIQSVLKIFL